MVGASLGFLSSLCSREVGTSVTESLPGCGLEFQGFRALRGRPSVIQGASEVSAVLKVLGGSNAPSGWRSSALRGSDWPGSSGFACLLTLEKGALRGHCSLRQRTLA